MRSKPGRGLLRRARTLFLAVLILIGLAALFTQTQWCRDLVRAVALDAINDAIRGSVRIGAVSGNLLTTIDLRDVLLVEAADTVAAISHVRLRYDLSGIFRGVLEIDSALIDTPRLALIQRETGEWNLLSAFAPAKERTESNRDTTQSSFRVNVRQFALHEADLRIVPRDTTTLCPRAVRLSIGGTGSYSASRQEIAIRMMQARLSHPDMIITRCSFSASHAAGDIALSDFVLTTPSNRIEAAGRLNVSGEARGSVTVSASMPDLTEFGSIVPPEFRSTHPEILATVGFEGEQLSLRCSLRDGLQVVQGTGTVVLTQVPRYSFKGGIQHLDPDVLSRMVSGGVDLNGTVDIRGEGFRAGDGAVRGSADLAASRLGAHRITKLHLEGEYVKGDVAARGRLDEEAGYLTFDARGDLRGAAHRFSISAESKNLDLARLLHQKMSSRVTMRLVARGREFAPAGMEGDLRASISRSMVDGFDVDSAQVHARASHGTFNLDSLFVESPAGEVRGKGELSRHGDIAARFTGTVRDLQPLRTIIGARRLTGEGTFGGSLEGRTDSLVAGWNIHLGGLSFNDLSATEVDGTGRLRLEKGIPTASGRGIVRTLREGGLRIDSMSVDGNYAAGRAHAIIEARDSTLFAFRADASATIDTTIGLTIHELVLTQGDSRWSQGDDPIHVNISKNSFDLDGFSMTSSAGSIVVGGRLAPDGVSRLECTVHNINLLPFALLIDTAFTSLGPVDTRVSFTGRMNNPVIEGTIASSRVAYAGWAVDSLAGSFGVRDSTCHWDVTAGLNGGNHVRLSGSIPLAYNGTDGVINRTRPAEINLFTTHLDLSTLIHRGGPFNVITGNLAADMHMTHTLDSPGVNGTIRIDGGSLQSTSLGLSYSDIVFACTGKGDSLVIDSSRVRGGKGTLTASGSVGLGPGMIRGKVETTNIRITASEFEVANTANYAASLNGTITVRNAGDTYSADGDLVLARSHVYLPYITKTLGTGDREHTPPMLVAAALRDTVPGGPQAKPLVEGARAKTDSTQRFSGRIRLTIPRGTWVRGKSLNLELSGTLEIVKTTPAMSLSGYIRCERGTYEFYGKKFVVKEGRLDFDGGKETNPVIAAELRYDFRDAYEQQQSLHMILANRIKSMTIRFTLGDEPISDGDAISYLIFGRRTDELSQSQQNGIANIGEVVAKDFAAGLVSAKLSSSVGEWAGLDVVRVSGEDNWQKATFTAGKYVTDEVFASYERGLFTSDPNDPITEIARIEYQFVRSLFLRLTKASDTSSGADLIIQIQ